VMQVGVVVEVRVRGRIVRRLDIRGLRLVRHWRQRTIAATIWNRGNNLRGAAAATRADRVATWAARPSRPAPAAGESPPTASPS
jgi:hypothetical protein